MLRLSVFTCIAVEERSDDGGFITSFGVLNHRYPPADDDSAGGGDLDEGDENVEQIGRARIPVRPSSCPRAQFHVAHDQNW
jgi:hypothetical protein